MIFHRSDAQEQEAWASLEAESCSGRHDDEITTEITEAGPLWLAAPGHQRFLERQG